MSMRLRIILPTEVLVDAPVEKVVAEADDGSFCLLPRHVDFVSALATGLLSYLPEGGEEQHVAVDAGILVKVGDAVLVSTFDAVGGVPLPELQEEIGRRTGVIEEEARVARSALARLEAGALQHFYELERSRHD
jgi:F-type H+-transporting ATPase subunit epsilon